MTTLTNADIDKFLGNFREETRPNFVVVYIKSLSDHLEKCEVAIAAQDPLLLRAEMHDFKSLGYTIGAAALGSLAEKLELNVIEGNTGAIFEDALGIIPLAKDLINTLEKWQSDNT